MYSRIKSSEYSSLIVWCLFVFLFVLLLLSLSITCDQASLLFFSRREGTRRENEGTPDRRLRCLQLRMQFYAAKQRCYKPESRDYKRVILNVNV